MKRIVVAIIAVLVTGGITYGQEKSAPNSDKLKCYDPFIGTWRYEGALLEELPKLAVKGTDCVIQFSWRRILNSSAIESRAVVEIKGKGTIYSEKVLIAWHAAAKKIVYAGAASDGSVFLGATEPDEKAKALHPSAEGVTSEGGKITYRGVFAKSDEDTMTWQALERTGSPIIEGPSPLYTFKRFRRDRESK